MSKVYVAGHAGMVGSAVVRNLARSDELITISRGQLDLLDYTRTFRFLKSENPDIVIVAAARIGGIQENIEKPVEFLYDNVAIGTNLIKGCLESGVTKLIYICSSCMYPRNYGTTLKEADLLAAPFEPTNEAHALAKVVGARLCEYCNKEYNTSYKTIISCNLYGPNDNYSLERSHLMAAIIHKLHEAKVNNLPIVTIWSDGSARREFLYVDDLAKFICKNLWCMESWPDYLNIGAGKDISVVDLYKKAEEVIGYAGSFDFDLKRPMGMRSKMLDCSLATELGWEVATDLDTGIALAYQEYLLQRSRQW